MANSEALTVGNSHNLRDVRRVAIASLVGTTIEWYDFFIFGLMTGIVFNRLYFPAENELVSNLLAWTSFAAGFLIRPIGGVIFGHFGDRFGRKPLLVMTIMLMGTATFLIGFLPTYAEIGIAAPVLLLLARIAQGIAVSGEWGGAVLMAYEYAPPNRRGFYAGFPQVGLAAGLFLSSGVLSLLSYLYSRQEFAAYGWRWAFYGSGVLLLVGLYVRLKVLETPEFLAAKAAQKLVRVPGLEVIKQSHLNVVLGWCACMIMGVWFTVFVLFSIPWLTNVLKFPRTTVLFSVMIAAGVSALMIPIGSYWSDVAGRRRVYFWSSLFAAVAGFPMLWAMQISPFMAGTMIVVAIGFIYAPIYGPLAALCCDLFDARVRYSGISIVYHIGAVLSLSLTPLVTTALLAANHNQPWLIAAYISFAGVLSALSLRYMRMKT
jgi:MHS family shikimate/dehydroshikimate transporter-like MFS transporter